MDYYSVCLGSFIPWDYKLQTKVIMDELGWQADELEGVPNEINEEGAKIECWMQGTRDYIKYIKRGYGRVTQLVNFEVRNGRMSTEDAKKWIDMYDGRKPQSLDVFLEYMGLTEARFNEIVSDFIVPPFEPNIRNIPIAKKLDDMDEWYREINKPV
jgi:hypothetical protein